MTDPQAAAARPSNLNLPNALTTLRIVLVPFFGVALLMDGGDSIALADDGVRDLRGRHDHRQDRRRHRPQSRGLITDFGKIADPIADKAMTGMAFVGPGHHLREPVVLGGDHRGAGPGVERDPAPALRAQEDGDRRRLAREAEDHLPGDRAQRPGAAAAATRTCRTGWRRPARSSSTWPWRSSAIAVVLTVVSGAQFFAGRLGPAAPALTGDPAGESASHLGPRSLRSAA